MFAINPFNNKMITSDKDEAKESKMQRAANFGKPIVAQGVQYWRKDGTLSKMVPFTNNSIYAGFFLNKEFIVVIDAQFIVHIIDLKTQKFFTCLRLECRPFHIYSSKQLIFLVHYVVWEEFAHYFLSHIN